MADFDEQLLLAAFPRLRTSAWELTSPETATYNCVAWAAGESVRWWWPVEPYYWPDRAPRALTIDAFITAFVSLGYSLAKTEEFEPGVRKVAIFATELGPTHVALQLGRPQWTSKLGSSVDIRHELRALEGAVYGEVRALMEARDLS